MSTRHKSFLVKIFGFKVTLIHGDTLVLDRWIWLIKRLQKNKNKERAIDIGCGTGAFSIGAGLLGYDVLGLSWNKRNQKVAQQRAEICKVDTVKFEEFDVRNLNERKDLVGVFNIVICCENIEHILDDGKLMKDISACLTAGGRLLLTTPNLFYRPITHADNRPFLSTEDGRHVRRGYSESMLRELCQNSGLIVDKISYCSGYLSQKITFFLRVLSKFHPLLGWIIVLPFRVFPLVFDGLVTRSIGISIN